ncbi:MAG: hypothetical protein H8E13_18140 [Actinobacteria bacterium]|nr:hypothetical protein [Actinomycetota bacterium]
MSTIEIKMQNPETEMQRRVKINVPIWIRKSDANNFKKQLGALYKDGYKNIIIVDVVFNWFGNYTKVEKILKILSDIGYNIKYE